MSDNYRERQLYHFTSLPPEEQRQAIQRLSASGHADSTIANATGLSIEFVRSILGEPQPKNSVPTA